MDCGIRTFRRGWRGADAEAVADLWNASVCEQYGFYPLPEAAYAQRVFQDRRFVPARLLLATHAGEVVGALHWDVVRERFYPTAGVVETVFVRPSYRRRGIASALLDRAMYDLRATGVDMVDGGGAWPYSPFYATLIDGSERSGIFVEDMAARTLLDRRGFGPDRESLVMHRDLSAVTSPPPLPPKTGIDRADRTGKATWLDYVFRGWTLQDHHLVTHRGDILSRAIFGRMDGLSDYAGKETYALFGVHTPEPHRGQGWATRNLQQALWAIRDRGGETVELHVYADNRAAVMLYRKLGFTEIGRTVALRLHWS